MDCYLGWVAAWGGQSEMLLEKWWQFASKDTTLLAQSHIVSGAGKGERKAPKSKDWVVKKKERRRKQQGEMYVMLFSLSRRPTGLDTIAWTGRSGQTPSTLLGSEKTSSRLLATRSLN